MLGDDGTKIPLEVNEGIRISSIVKQLHDRLGELPPQMRERIATALDQGGAPETSDEGFVPPLSQTGPEIVPPGTPRIDEDGRVSWTMPIEISVALPMFAKPKAPEPVKGPAAAIVEAVKNTPSPTDAYRNRGGYKPAFIRGFTIPLPVLGQEIIADAAVNSDAEAGDNQFALPYTHFSIMMNARRKLAFVCACNIDGATAKNVNRQTKAVSPLLPTDPSIESLEPLATGEASEGWRFDPRIPREAQTGDIYQQQKVAGFPNPSDPKRIARIFQRGHLIRRLDPAWGTDAMALDGEADTFHWTNCSPQVGFFNQGTAPASQPGTAGGKLWRTAENYVLRNAVAEDTRVTCFTGPIFADDDRAFRGVQVPGRFYKLMVWSEDGSLRSLALLVDQRPVIHVWPEAVTAEAIELTADEAFGDPDELRRSTPVHAGLGRR